MSEKIAKELNEKGIGKIEDDALRVLLTDTVIYKNAQELQDEFYTIYGIRQMMLYIVLKAMIRQLVTKKLGLGINN